ncbi:hypothetical protein BDV38DRAFT_294024 [Aspergillus pseudotamarii]|uniref:CHY and RING finger domain protein n=1 Tax=Aspergillus pseudotamarii TaxID=132259 RepID=A0A5N6SN94_ASPPS|nr:uncharacterized protein BDV38DRAFT_294024 [Aspergillus pseudotamarii]KAE8136156.1 hypothetical protein BDV38DRAFT_294024 [Aspergillus pseudotamarii]
MSGLITSLLIEPVVRQARRLSQQTEESDSPVTQASSIYDWYSSDRGEDDCDNIARGVMSYSEQEIHPNIGAYGEYVASEASPSSVMLWPTGFNDQNHETEPLSLSHRARQIIDNNVSEVSDNHAVIMHGSDLTEPRQATSVATSTHDASQQTSSTGGGTQRVSQSHLNLVDTGGHSSLPEDDGMGALRKKIHSIRDLNYSSMEQARMIHDLMTENYNASRSNLDNQMIRITPSLLRPRSSDRSVIPNHRWSSQSFDQQSLAPATPASITRQENQYCLTAEDLKPTFSPRDELELPPEDIDDTDAEEFEEACLGCRHYKRNVKLQCYACKKWYTCRFCHDEAEDHHLDRPKTENMLCMLCGHAQPATQFCRQCGEQSSQYYCNICKLWDNDTSKSIYHCNDCGICRIGQGLGKDFFHCKTCCVCLPISIENTHRCIERSTQCDCPICGDYMFTSPETVVFMRCGHSIHQKCLSEYSKNSYRCPICSKTITNMESTFRNLDRTIQSQPMPAEFNDTKALIYCNDCGAKCESYNTAQIRLLSGNVLDSVEDGYAREGFIASRTRSSSQGTGNIALPALTTSILDTNSGQDIRSNARPNAPISAESSERFSYSISRGRAVSPVISNYFGIPPDRGSERPKSTSFFNDRAPKENETENSGEIRFWGAKFKYRYGFLSRGTESADGTSEANDEEDEDEGNGDDDERSWCSNSEEGNEEEDDDDDDDDDEKIDIFGHR